MHQQSSAHNQKIRGPILSDQAPRTFGLGDAGFPAWGPHQAPQRPNHPYEDVTSTEARQRLVNGSPPFRGNQLREDPTSPVLRAARAREVRARLSARWNATTILKFRPPRCQPLDADTRSKAAATATLALRNALRASARCTSAR